MVCRDAVFPCPGREAGFLGGPLVGPKPAALAHRIARSVNRNQMTVGP
jgi:hypothetical protein